MLKGHFNDTAAEDASASDERMMKTMKNEDDEMRAEYDFRGGVRGKYYERCEEGTTVVLLESDLAKIFETRLQSTERCACISQSTVNPPPAHQRKAR